MVSIWAIFRRICCLLAVIAGIVSAELAWSQTKPAKDPLVAFKIVTNDISAETFIEKMRELADLCKFAVRVDRIGTQGTDILIQLWRHDINAIIVNTLPAPSEYDMFLYSTEQSNPPSMEVIQSVSRTIKQELGDIKGIEIVDQPIVPY